MTRLHRRGRPRGNTFKQGQQECQVQVQPNRDGSGVLFISENKSPDEEAEAGNMTTNFAPNASDTSGKIYPMLPEDQPQK